MLYRIAVVVVSVLVLMGAGGCGGGGHSAPLPSLVSSSYSVSGVEQTISVDAHGLRRAFHFTYDYSAYPSDSGMAVVSMLDDFRPKPPGVDPCTISVDIQGNKATARLGASGTGTVTTHFRYDASEWEVTGVGQLNPFPHADDFISLCVVPEPGVLLVRCIPVGAGAALASGEFARVFLARPGTRTASTCYMPPNSETSMPGVIWFANRDSGLNPQVYCSGTVTYGMDGEWGDLRNPAEGVTKDGDLVDAGETDGHRENLPHDVAVVPFADYGKQIGAYGELTVSWTERLTGDHNNDGVVTVNDLAPIGYLWSPDPDPDDLGDDNEYIAISKWAMVQNGSFANMFLNMAYPGDLPDISPWYFDQTESKDVETFYFFDLTSWTHPGIWYRDDDFDFGDGKTPATDLGSGYTWRDVYTSIDGFGDGFIRDYYNWDENGDNEPEGYYDEFLSAGSLYAATRPGDTTPIALHWGESINGYRVDWRLGDGEWHTDKHMDRDLDGEHIGIAFEQYENPTHNLSAPEKWAKARLNYSLDIDRSGLGIGMRDEGAIDVRLVPYVLWDTHGDPAPEQVYYASDSQALILEDVVDLVADTRGPEYHIEDEGGQPGDPPEGWPATRAWPEDAQGVFFVEEDDQYIDLKFLNADDKDGLGNWYSGGEQARYDLYALQDEQFDEQNPPDPSVFFQQTNILVENVLESDGLIRAGTDPRVLVISSDFTGIFYQKYGPGGENPFDNPVEDNGKIIWFGVRAEESEEPYLAEYAGNASTDANEWRLPMTVNLPLGYGPAYNVTESDPDWPADPKGLYTASHAGQYAFHLEYFDADDREDEFGQFDPGYEIVKYELFGYYSPDAQEAGTPPLPGAFWDGALSMASWPENASGTGGSDGGLRTNDIDVGDDEELIGALHLDNLELVWFCVRACERAAPYNPEYYPPANCENNVLVPVQLRDYLDPYFIYVMHEYGPDATEWPRGVYEAIGASVSSIQVLFNPAIDPPYYDPEESLTYRCFFSPESLIPSEDPNDPSPDVQSIWDYLEGSTPSLPTHIHESLPALEFCYRDKVPIGESPDPDDFSMLITEYEDHTPLQIDETYWIYICVQDNAAPTPNHSRVHYVVQRATVDLYEAQAHTLVQYISDGGVVGDLIADSSTVYMLYPAYDDGLLQRKLVYQEYSGGAFEPPHPNILAWSSAQNLSLAQAKLDFFPDTAGRPLVDGGSHAGLVSLETAGLEVYEDVAVTKYEGNGQWSPITIIAQERGGPYNMSHGPSMTTFQYFDEQDAVQSYYFLPWTFTYYSLQQALWMDGELRKSVSYDASTWSEGVKVVGSGSYSRGGVPITARSDITTRSLGIGVDGSIHPGYTQQFLQSNNARGNILFMLANGTHNPVEEHVYRAVELFYGNDPANGFSGYSNLWPVLEGLVSSESPSIGPNSLAVARSSTAGEGYVYVAFCGAGLNEESDEDGLGLHVAYAEYGGTIVGNWSSPNPAGLITDDYYFVPEVVIPTYDVIDLAVKPEASIADDCYEGLGCAFVAPRGRLMLAETVGSGSGANWEFHEINPTGGPVLDAGRFRWVKLTYQYDPVLGESVPYVMYSLRVNPTAFKYDIKIWRPGGFS